MTGGSAVGPGPMPICEDVALRVRLVMLDVDGVLSDGGIYIGAMQCDTPIELKRFHVEDGIAVRMLQRAGIHVAIVSGRVSQATRIRAAELDIADVIQDGNAHKLPAVRQLLDRHGVDWSEAAHLGDDLADLPILCRVGLPATVANGVPEVRRLAAWQSSRPGGNGAAREFAEALLQARGEWEGLVDEYRRERDD